MTITAKTPVLLSAVRTPFVNTAGAFSRLMNYQLCAQMIEQAVSRAGVAAKDVDMVSLGAVLQDVETSNVAREAMLSAGLAATTPAFSVSMAGLSPTVASTNVCDMIALGRADVAISGGGDNFSAPPVGATRRMRRAVMQVHQHRSAKIAAKELAGLKPRDFVPELPAAVDLTTGMNMGQCTELMVQKFGLGREECDAFAAASHANALAAWQTGQYATQVVSVQTPEGHVVDRDDAMRADATVDKLGRLPTVFDKDNGIVTAGNASRLTDGATAMVWSSYEKAQQLGQPPLVALKDYAFAGVTDLRTEMLLGPAMAIPKLLQRNGLAMDDVAVWELHEAFAAQLLVNSRCLGSKQFCKDYHGLSGALGELPTERLNTWGGSLALGNPFAATGGRLVATAAARLQKARQRYAVVSSCAGGGLGAALLLENPGFH